MEKKLKDLIKKARPKRKRFNSQAKDIEESKRDARIYNQAIDDFVKKLFNSFYIQKSIYTEMKYN